MEADSVARYVGWAKKMKSLDFQWGAVASSFGNCFAPVGFSWWMNLKRGTSRSFTPPFTALRSPLEDMSWRECKMASQSSDKAFCFFQPVMGGQEDDLTRHFASRAEQVRQEHSGRGKPNPGLTTEDKHQFAAWFADAKELLDEIHEHATARRQAKCDRASQVCQAVAQLRKRVAKAEARFNAL